MLVADVVPRDHRKIAVISDDANVRGNIINKHILKKEIPRTELHDTKVKILQPPDVFFFDHCYYFHYNKVG